MKIRQRDINEKGTALVELAYILPLMLLILMSLIDVGNALNQYLRITQAVQEGTRLASSLPDLEVNTYNPDSPPPRHGLVLARVSQIIELQQIAVSDVQLSSTLTPAVAGATAANTVSVRVEARYRSIFPMFNNMRLTARAVAPYLYRQIGQGGLPAS